MLTVLKTFDTDDVEEGMFFDSIAKQQGKFKIISRGRVTSLAAITHLKNKGILSVVVDMSKQIKPEVVAQQEPEPEKITEPPEEASFEAELGVAAKLHLKGKHLQKTMLESLGKNLPIDIAIPEAFTKNLVSSINRNPNALMCTTKIREKDTYLLEHSLNVAILLANFGTHLGLNEEQIQELALSGFLHDIGKIKIPDEILHKPGRLNDQEMTTMKDHVYYGTKVLIEMGMPDSIVETIGQHHERLDGYGYPEGLRGNEISTFGRMIAIVDTYDAITADRCYKVGMSSKKALQILLQDAPEKYDEGFVTQFVQCIGIFPAGSLVKLNNQKIAMVLKQHPVYANKPVVKVFYSVRGSHYLEPKELDLTAASNGVKIVDAVIASDYKLDFIKYFNESIVI
ncbi:HD-GYP domain-containing protein [Paraglaciecola psychrophila]|uniref:Metal dependent phosphohydrolase n=1 Tax=Paraglaciecola psychrophila 170 TaxID=1129794 RepID=K7A7Y8_9ALTE|nr:HD-GYP domain-containing protein [Paraglaciecola psychrophila]AGH47687.1 metal dependent phosphohydrolase [Paraglaciecola psychrophila 170]GAC36873.1 metal dependent phosphohydrolase [Paraglaciecola psychrophila 170]